MLQQPNLNVMLDPIKQYIENNQVNIEDIPKIVSMYFPPDEKVEEIAEWLHEQKLIHAPTAEQRIIRTKEILRGTLECIAMSFLKSTDPEEILEEIFESIADESIADHEYEIPDEGIIDNY